MGIDSNDLLKLRQSAEMIVENKKMESPSLDAEFLQHEVNVHRIELEMQNEQLKETEVELQLALERFTKLYHHAPIGYVTMDAKGLVHDLNETLVQLLGKPAETVRGHHFVIHLNDDTANAFRQRLPAFFKKPEGKVIDVSLIASNGNLIHVEIRGERQSYKDLLACSLVNVTERKKAEERHLNLENQLRQKHKMEAVGIMAGGIAHNFNNNLAIILGNIEMAQFKQKPDSEAQPFLQNAKIAVNRSRDLVSKILTYSRQGTQKKRPILLKNIIDETLTLIGSTLPSSVKLLKKYSKASEVEHIYADDSQIQEVIINLVNNAIRAMNETGELKISLQSVNIDQDYMPEGYSCAPGRYAQLSVQDTGCGMSSELIENIFDPFFSTKQEHEGAGMGLATVHGIVAQQDGMIKVSSVLQKGTTFDLFFPITEGISTKEYTIQEGESPRGAGHILYVEDDEELANINNQIFTEIGYSISLMYSAEEALELFATNPDRFDLVITDQTLPNITGIELIQKLKKIKSDIPTILCTGFSSKVDEKQAKELGADAFMMKPIEFAQILKTIKMLLGS